MAQKHPPQISLCHDYHNFPVAFILLLIFVLILKHFSNVFTSSTSSENVIQRTSLFKTKHSVFVYFPPLQSLPGGSQRDSDYNQGTAAPAMPINVGGLKMEQREREGKCLCLHLHTLPYWTGCWGVSAQLVALQQTLQGHVAPARRTPTQTCLHKLSSSLKSLSFCVCPYSQDRLTSPNMSSCLLNMFKSKDSKYVFLCRICARLQERSWFRFHFIFFFFVVFKSLSSLLCLFSISLSCCTSVNVASFHLIWVGCHVFFVYTHLPLVCSTVLFLHSRTQVFQTRFLFFLVSLCLFAI